MPKSKGALSKHITFYLVIAGLLQVVWGLVPSASKFVIDEIPVELYIALRWSISGAIFAAYLTVTKSWRRVSLKTVGAVVGLGILGYGFGSIGTLYSLKIGGVTNFALMTSMSPAVTSLVAILFLRERPVRLFYFALPVSIVGLIMVAYGKSEISTAQIAITSCSFLIFADFLEAIIFVYSKKFKSEVGIAQYLAMAQIGAAAASWVAQGVYFHQTSHIYDLSTRGFAAALFVSIVACVLCFAVLYWLLEHVDGHRLSLFEGVHALSATTFGLILFKETLRPIMLVGGFLILCGLLAGNWPKKSEEQAH